MLMDEDVGGPPETLPAPSAEALSVADRISEYLLTGMHHATAEGREAIARLIDVVLATHRGAVGTPSSLIKALLDENGSLVQEMVQMAHTRLDLEKDLKEQREQTSRLQIELQRWKRIAGS